MFVRSALINPAGMDAVLRYAEDPSLMLLEAEPDAYGLAETQTYIPGISIPEANLLNTPFNVPIIGDNESVSLSIDWPMRRAAKYSKRVTFIGQLVAEKITFDSGRDALVGDHSDATEDDMLLVDEDSTEDAVDEEFYGFTGDYGGFLRAVVEIVRNKESEEITKSGAAEFYCMEDEEEFYTLSKLMDSNQASAKEIVDAVRMHDLGKLLASPRSSI